MKQTNGKAFQYTVFTLCVAAAAALFLRAREIRAAILAGASLCFQNILPPVFPMLILSGLLAETGLPPKLQNGISAPFRYFPGVSSFLFPALLFGAAGGYPVGVKMLAKLTCGKKTHDPEAAALAVFNVNPGPAYAILAVGAGIFGSAAMGCIFYLSVTAANALLFRLLNRKQFGDRQEQVRTFTFADLTTPLENAVTGAIRSALQMTAWILIFQAIRAGAAPLTDLLPFQLTLEITGAVEACRARGFPTFCAFALGFGGLSLYFQLAGDLRALGVRASKYFACRAAAGLLSAVFTRLALFVFPPVAAAAFPAGAAVRVFRTDALGAASLLFACAAFIVDSMTRGAAPKNTKIFPRGT